MSCQRDKVPITDPKLPTSFTLLLPSHRPPHWFLEAIYPQAPSSTGIPSLSLHPTMLMHVVPRSMPGSSRKAELELELELELFLNLPHPPPRLTHLVS